MDFENTQIKPDNCEGPTIISNVPTYDDRSKNSILYEQNLEEIKNFKPYIERYFTEKYSLNFNSPEKSVRNDTCLKIHNNGLCLLYLAEGHTVFKENKTVARLNFQVTEKLDRLKNSFSGKRKRGAQLVTPESIICYMETEDDCKFPIRAGTYGKILEINSEVINNPNLVITDNRNMGFVCIIDQEPTKTSGIKFLTKQEYLNDL